MNSKTASANIQSCLPQGRNVDRLVRKLVVEGILAQEILTIDNLHDLAVKLAFLILVRNRVLQHNRVGVLSERRQGYLIVIGTVVARHSELGGHRGEDLVEFGCLLSREGSCREIIVVSEIHRLAPGIRALFIEQGHRLCSDVQVQQARQLLNVVALTQAVLIDTHRLGSLRLPALVEAEFVNLLATDAFTKPQGHVVALLLGGHLFIDSEWKHKITYLCLLAEGELSL